MQRPLFNTLVRQYIEDDPTNEVSEEDLLAFIVDAFTGHALRMIIHFTPSTDMEAVQRVIEKATAILFNRYSVTCNSIVTPPDFKVSINK